MHVSFLKDEVHILSCTKCSHKLAVIVTSKPKNYKKEVYYSLLAVGSLLTSVSGHVC